MRKYAWFAPVLLAFLFTSWCSRKTPVEGQAKEEISSQTPTPPAAVPEDGSPKAGETMEINIPGTEVSFTMVYIPGGTFEMEVGGTSTSITIDPFWIGEKEVQHDEYTIFRNLEYDSDASNWDGGYSADAATRPSPPYTDISFGMGSTGGFPAVSMTQQGGLFYSFWLYQKTGKFFRLPTEAEWTFACLAGSDSDMPPNVTEADLGDYAWFIDNSSEKFQKVGLKKPNAYGLYDILGNVAEWTLDNFSEDYAAATADMTTNPWVSPAKRYGRTVKGGSYDDYADQCTCTSRVKSTVQWQKRDPQIPKSLWWNTDSPNVGMRLVMPAKELPAEEIAGFLEKAVQW